MISYQELDRALARWKARAQGGGAELVQDTDDAATIVSAIPMPVGAAPTPARGTNGVPAASDHTGEIDLGDEVVETYDD